MGIFNQPKTSNIEANEEISEIRRTVISLNSVVDGSIKNDGNIDILGIISGDVESSDGVVEVYSTGTVSGNIIASGDVTIAGIVKGIIKSKGKVTIKETSAVSGDIMCAALSIEPSAKYGGHCVVNSTEDLITEDKESSSIEQGILNEDND